MASVRTTNGTLVSQGLTQDAAEQRAGALNAKAEKLGLETRYEVDGDGSAGVPAEVKP